jgi:cytochrome c556
MPKGDNMRGFGWRLLAAGAVLCFVTSLCQSSGNSDLSIKDIMDKAHKGNKSVLRNLGKELGRTPPDWSKVDPLARELESLGEALTKATPAKGDKASWDKLAGGYHADTKALASAADQKNVIGARAALGRLGKACQACHNAHRGE